MANAEHMGIIQQGVKAWNEWREKHPEATPDLSFANLNGAHLSFVNFDNANLSFADLSFANLSFAYLRNTDFTNAILHLANLNDANLNNAHLNGANLSRATLNQANLSFANLSFIKFDNADLSSANLSNVDLSNANFYNTNLIDATLSGANFTNARVARTIFGDVDLRAQLRCPCSVCLHHTLIKTYRKECLALLLPLFLQCRFHFIFDPGTCEGMLGEQEQKLVLEMNRLIDARADFVANLHILLVKPAPDSVILEIDMQACQQREGVEPVLCILPSSREEARTVLRNTLATSAPPWGICCYNDEVAFAVLAALADENIAIPLTAAVVGCDNIPLAQWSLPALTTIAFHNEPELDALIEAIVALSHGEAVSWRTHKTLTLVKRASA